LPGQPAWELKLGFDARPAKSKLRYGASLAFAKAQRYQAEPQTWVEADDDFSLEAYGVYAIDRNQRFRLSLRDLARREAESVTSRGFGEGHFQENQSTFARLRLDFRYEMVF